jgi:hypothetical protein
VKWCCSTFEQFFENGGARGFAVFVKGIGIPVVQCRATDAGNEQNLLSVLCANPEVGIVSTTQEFPMRYCPWCGREVLRYYRSHLSEILREDLGL